MFPFVESSWEIQIEHLFFVYVSLQNTRIFKRGERDYMFEHQPCNYFLIVLLQC